MKNVYRPWIEQMANTFPKNLLEKAIIEVVEQVGFRFGSLQELYKREQHKVARKVIFLTGEK